MPERARNGMRVPDKVGSKPERAAKGKKVQGIEREKAKKSQKGQEESQKFHPIFPQNFF